MIVAVNTIYAIAQRSLKKKFGTSTGFEPVTSRLPVRCSTNWAMKPLTLGAGELWWIFSGFFTQLHKLRSLRRSFLHFHFISAVHISSIRVARNFCGSLFLRIGDFLCFAGTNFCDFQKLPSAQHWWYFRFYWVRAMGLHFFNNKPVSHCIPFCFWMQETSCDWTDTIS